MKTCTKIFGPYPFAHRQPTHDGHCKLIHGHDWKFEVEFAAATLDENGFVIDFGKMKFVKEFLAERFDHTLVLPLNDPEFDTFQQLQEKGLAKLTLLAEASAEGLADYLFQAIDELAGEATSERVGVVRVTVYEDEKNSATVTA